MGLLIQNGTVVTADKTFAADVLVEGEVVKDVRAGIGQNRIDPAGHTVVDARGMLISAGWD
jgi:dihydropyrimidinase